MLCYKLASDKQGLPDTPIPSTVGADRQGRAGDEEHLPVLEVFGHYLDPFLESDGRVKILCEQRDCE